MEEGLRKWEFGLVLMPSERGDDFVIGYINKFYLLGGETSIKLKL